MQTSQNNPLINNLLHIKESSENLKAALISRKTNVIMTAVQNHEKVLSESSVQLNSISSLKADSVNDPEKQEIYDLVSDIRRIQNSNWKIASALSNLITKTFDKFSLSESTNTGVYRPNGTMSYRSAPVLVEQRG